MARMGNGFEDVCIHGIKALFHGQHMTMIVVQQYQPGSHHKARSWAPQCTRSVDKTRLRLDVIFLLKTVSQTVSAPDEGKARTVSVPDLM